MKKILLSMAALALLGACSFKNQDENHFVVVSGEDDTSYLKDIDACPKVHIRQNDTKIVQVAEYRELFTIEAIGYEGRCYFNKKLGKDKAIVKPKFKITRLEESDVTDVHFSYYLETVEGPTNYLGKKTYFAEVHIPRGVTVLDYSAEGGELTIPVPGTYNMDIYLGIKATVQDLEYRTK